ncbi:MAG: AAA family ATPase [Candidatus Kapaibacterium sp.]
MKDHPRLFGVRIDGYRPFKEFGTKLRQLEVIVGANGAGKSALIEFLRMLRDGMDREIPPGIVAGGTGRRVYHTPGPEQINWAIRIKGSDNTTIEYSGQLAGLVGNEVAEELVMKVIPNNEPENPPIDNFLLAMRGGRGLMSATGDAHIAGEPVISRFDKFALGTISNPLMTDLIALREQIRNWRFYSSFDVNNNEIRQPVMLEQAPVLAEDCRNLSSVIQYLKNEEGAAYDELNHYLRLLVPGFRELKVRAFGARGQVLAFWREDGLDDDLSLADLSDGILRLICWTLLCVVPHPPTLICIDEPDQGVHPRTLPILAELFQKVSERTQVIVTTHNSYFLSQFDLDSISVMRKEDGRAKFLRPQDSQVLVDMLQDFGSDEIELLHRSDELERLA